VAGIEPGDSTRPTRLRVTPVHAPWDVFTLVAHINVATHMVQDLVADQTEGAPSNDHTTFFVTNAAEVAPAIDDFTRNSAKGLAPEQGRCVWTS
jgi:hypothetical protein